MTCWLVYLPGSAAGQEADFSWPWQHTGGVWGPDVSPVSEELYASGGYSHLYQICRVRGGRLLHHRPHCSAEIRHQSLDRRGTPYSTWRSSLTDTHEQRTVNHNIYLLCRLNGQWTGSTTRIEGYMRRTWELRPLTSSSVAIRLTWRSRICCCPSDSCLTKWTSTCCQRSRTFSTSSSLPGLSNSWNFLSWALTQKRKRCINSVITILSKWLFCFVLFFQQNHTANYEGHDILQLWPVFKSWVIICFFRIYGTWVIIFHFFTCSKLGGPFLQNSESYMIWSKKNQTNTNVHQLQHKHWPLKYLVMHIQIRLIS